MIRLHYYPGNASMAPHILLEELGVPFELVRVERDSAAHKSPDYLKLNPNGLIPVLQDGDLVLYETAAILLHLADKHPEAVLAPGVGTPERAEFYKWLVWLTNTPQSMAIHYFYPHRMADDEAGAAVVKAHAEAALGRMLDQLDAHLASHAGPWLLGANYSAADALAFVICRWTRGMTRPARSLPHIGPYLQRMLARPAVQKVFATEQPAMPHV